jgi:hypothetical protein
MKSDVGRDLQFPDVTAEQDHVRGPGAQHLRDQVTEPSVADDRDSGIGRDSHLLDNAACRRERFHEHRRLVIHFAWDFVQVGRRQREVLRKRAVAPADAENRLGQCSLMPRSHHAQAPHPTLISPATRLSIQ